MSINSYENNPLSWQPDKNKLKRPIYKSLISQLKKDILSHKLKTDSPLPSQRDLADYLDINFTTVGQVYKYGVENGLLYTIIGRGTFVSQNALESIAISLHGVGEDIIDLGLVSSFESHNELVLPLINSISSSPDIIKLLSYHNPKGTSYQLSVAQKWLSTQGVESSVEQIAIVSGVQNGLAVTLSALFSPGDRIAVDRYTYSNFIDLAHLLNLEIVPIDFDEEGMCVDLLEMQCKKKKIHGIFLMPSCNNPVGFQISQERRYQLAKIIKKENILVIEDDIHSFLTTYHQKKVINPFHKILPEQTIYLGGISKFICSGLRVAYLVFPKKVAWKIERAIFNINVKSSSLDAEIVTQALDSNIADRILKEKLHDTEVANQMFDMMFNLERPSNPLPFYRNIPITSKISQSEIENTFFNNGVRLYHSNRFTTRKQSDSFVRISLSSNSLDVLERGLEIVSYEISKYR